MSSSDRDRLIIFAVILSLSSVITYNYVNFVERPNIPQRLELHNRIISGEAPAPYRYRVLVPYVTQVSSRALAATGLLSFRQAWIISYITFDFISISLFLATLFIFLIRWHGKLLSLLGVMFCAGVLPVTLRDHYYQPWSLIEAWFFCLAMLAVCRKRFITILIITILASINRVTGLFIPFVFLAGSISAPGERGRALSSGALTRFITLAVVSLVVIYSLRIFLGFSDNIHTVNELWLINTSKSGLALALINLSLFAGAWWVFFVKGVKLADPFTRNLMFLMPLYLVPIILFGVWKEARLFLPVYPIIISMGLFYLKARFEDKLEKVQKNGSE